MNVSKTAAICKNIQQTICRTLEDADGTGKFTVDLWEKEVGSGLTRVMQNGSIIEKAGVNFSHVEGDFSENMALLLGEKATRFKATGISSILHSGNPFVPTIYLNVRHFSLDNGSSWFGGGINLTPMYVNPEEARRFHQTLKDIWDKYDISLYPAWKHWADDYFFIEHRHETRGIGGIFFDRIAVNNNSDYEKMLCLTSDLAHAYPVIYAQLMKNNGHKPFTEAEKHWQKIRRGRYVEFNLIYDRGTKFGLESDGNTESILVSLPAEMEWVYQHQPEAQTQALLKKGIEWV